MSQLLDEHLDRVNSMILKGYAIFVNFHELKETFEKTNEDVLKLRVELSNFKKAIYEQKEFFKKHKVELQPGYYEEHETKSASIEPVLKSHKDCDH